MLLDWAIENSIVAAALACLILGLGRLRPMGPAWRHALWLIVLVKLMSPPLLAWPYRLSGIAILSTKAFSIRDAVARSERTLSDRGRPVDPNIRHIVSSESVNVPRESLVHPAAASEVSGAGWLRSDLIVKGDMQATIRRLLYGIWIGGALFVGIVQLIRILRMQQVVKRSTVDNDHLTPLVQQLAKVLGVRPPRVATTDEIRSPLIWAFGRPTLIWPSRLVMKGRTEIELEPQVSKAIDAFRALPASTRFPNAPRLSTTAFEGILVHELAHLKRRDHWVGWIELFASCIWWWNPVFWLVRYQLRENAELACDTWVVSTVPESRRGYAEALLTICQFQSEPVMAIPVLGIASQGRHAFQRRLQMLLQESKTSKLSRMGLASLALCAVLVLPSWSQDGGLDDLFSADDFPAEESAQDVASLDDELLFGDADADTAEATNDDLFADEPIPSPELRDQNHVGAVLAAALKNRESLSNTSKSEMVQLAKKLLADRQPLSSRVRRDLLGAVARWETHDAESSNGTKTVTLERTTYRLPSNKARLFNEFLRQAVDEDAATVRMKPSQQDGTSDESYLVITATPEAQQAIGQFIAFLRASPAPKSLQLYSDDAPVLYESLTFPAEAQ